MYNAFANFYCLSSFDSPLQIFNFFNVIKFIFQNPKLKPKLNIK